MNILRMIALFMFFGIALVSAIKLISLIKDKEIKEIFPYLFIFIVNTSCFIALLKITN